MRWLPSRRPHRQGEMDDRLTLDMLCGLLRVAAGGEVAPNMITPARDHAAWRAIVALAAGHAILPSLYTCILRNGLSEYPEPDLLEYLEAVHSLNAQRNEVLILKMKAISRQMHEAGIDFAFLKGAALLLHDIYPSSGMRFLRDIDILVEKDSIRKVASLLESDGFAISEHPGSHDTIEATDNDQRVVVEVHQAVLPAYLAHIAPADRFLRERVRASRSENAFTPSPMDMLLHNAAHAMLHDGYYRLAELPLRDAYDFALIAERYDGEIDWSELARWRSAFGTRRADSCVMTFYVNAVRELFAIPSIPELPGTFGSRLTTARWRARGGAPLDVSAAHTGIRNLAEGPWRYLAVPSDRARVHSALLDPRKYRSVVIKLIEVSRRTAGRFG